MKEKPVITALGISRLLVMCDFLDKLPRKKFDIGVVSGDFYIPEEEPKNTKMCPTKACVCGWIPAVFPALVAYGRPYGWRLHKRGGFTRSWAAFDALAVDVFQLRDASIAADLFSPTVLPEGRWGLPGCGRDATPKQVSKMLRKFVNKAQTGQLNN